MQDGAQYEVRKCTGGNKDGGLYAVVGYICTHLNIFQVIRKFYISGIHCIVNIIVWEVCPIIAHLKMADS